MCWPLIEAHKELDGGTWSRDLSGDDVLVAGAIRVNGIELEIRAFNVELTLKAWNVISCLWLPNSQGARFVMGPKRATLRVPIFWVIALPGELLF